MPKGRISYSTAALISVADTILLVKRNTIPFKGFWALPGGRKEESETFEECVKREVEEETGLKTLELGLFGCMRVKNKYGLQYAIYYTLTPYEFFAPQCSSDEVSSPTYFRLADLPNYLVPFHKTIINDYREEYV